MKTHQQPSSALSWAMPTNKVVHILQELEKLGIGNNELLNNTGITKDVAFNSAAYVTFDQSLKLIENALKLSQQPHLGLQIGAKESASTCGLMGYAMSCSATIEHAASLAIKYQKASPTLTDMSVNQSDLGVTFRAAPMISVSTLLPFVIEEVFSATLNIFSLLTGESVRPRQVNLSYKPPSYEAMYGEAFQCPVTFNAPACEMIFDSAALDRPIITANPVARDMATQLCDKHLSEWNNSADIAQRVRFELLISPGAFPNEDAVAERIGISARSLRRQLKDKGLTFQTIYDSAREQLAVEYLNNTTLPLVDIAELVGFSDASNFRRAFKRWTGKVPSDIRNNNPSALIS